MSHPILTPEQIDALNRGELQDALRERELSSGGSTVILNARLKDWVADQRPTAAATKPPKPSKPDETPDATLSSLETTPPADETPDADASDLEIEPPTADVATEDTVVTEATGISNRVTTYVSNPEEEELPDVPVLEGDQPAESYRDLCKTNTVVRVHDTHIVQVLEQPFDGTGRHCAYQQLGLRLRSFVNDELEEIDNALPEEPVIDENAPVE